MKDIRRRGGALRTVGIFALGAALGSIFALLYAPASGEVTRKRLIMKARNLKRAVTRRLGQTGRVLTAQAQHVREAATEWIAERVGQRNGRHTVRRTRHLAHANN